MSEKTEPKVADVSTESQAEPKRVTTEEATQVLLEAQKARVAECEKEIDNVLKRFQCGLLPVVTLVGGSAPQAEVRVVPR